LTTVDPPLVSCVVPVHNGERFLAEALDSVFGQTHRPIEVLVADDGSTDGTPAVVAAYGTRVRYVRQDNAGPAAARNLGLGIARGEFVGFLDADDRWPPGKLARQLERFVARPELGVSATHVQNFWMAEVADEAARLKRSRHAGPVPGYVASTLLVRRSLFTTVGRFNPELGHGEVLDWLLRAGRCGVMIELLPDVLLERRLHRSNRSRLNALESREEFLHLVKARLDIRRRGTADTVERVNPDHA
jgi:glycosyltransferase involved in cell wall biosynthesis